MNKTLVCIAMNMQTGPASAYFLSGNDLLKRCRSQETYSRAVCDNYIVGVVDATMESNRICVAKNVTKGQVRDIAVKWLNENPARTHEPSARLVAEAMGQAFPCRR